VVTAGRGGVVIGLKGVGGGVPAAGLFVGFNGEERGRFGGGAAIQNYLHKKDKYCLYCTREIKIKEAAIKAASFYISDHLILNDVAG
jgi:hypothetical protein